MSLQSKSDNIVQEYIFKTGDSVKSIDDIYKRLRKKELQDKKLAKVEKELRGETDRLAKSNKKLATTMTAASVVVGNLATTGLVKLKAAMGSVIRQALDFEDWVGQDAEVVRRLSASVKNLVPALDVARMRTRLTTGDFKLNEKQLGATLKAAIHLTRVYKTDFATSLDKVTDVIKRGSSRSFKELGFNTDLLGTAAEKTAYALKAITERFGGMNIQAANANERIDQLKNTFWDSLGAMGASILKTDAVTSALKRLSSAAREIAEGMSLLGEKGRGRQVELQEEKQALLGTLAGKSIWQRPMFGAVKSHKEMRARIAEIDKEFTANRLVREAAANRKRFAGEVSTAKASADAMIAEFERTMQAFTRTGTAQAGTRQRAGKRAKPGVAGGETSLAIDARPRWPGPPVDEIERKANLKNMQEQIAQAKKLADAQADVARGVERTNRAMRDEAIDSFIAGHEAMIATLVNAKTEIQDMAVNSLTQLAGSLWAAADAAIQGGQSFGAAIGAITKRTLLGVAEMATVKGMFAMAEYVASWFCDVTKLHAAGMFFATATTAGGAGLGMSAGGVGGSTGASTGAAGKASARRVRSSDRAIGKKTGQDDYQIVINNYYGDEKNPSKNWVQQQVITRVAVKKAA